VEPSKHTIKLWLKRFGHSRDWLADQCSKSKNTVNNWLSTNIDIPPATLHLIERLIADDEAKSKAATADDPHRFAVEVEPEEFDAINAAATAKGMLIRDWAREVLVAACAEDEGRAAKSSLNAAPLHDDAGKGLTLMVAEDEAPYGSKADAGLAT